MANLITLARLLLLFVVIWIAYTPPSWLHLLGIAMLIVVFVGDALDGYVARRRGESSVFGAVFDIAGDRVVEYSMWLVVTDLELAPVWVPLLFFLRGSIVDAIRSQQVVAAGQSPFSMIESPVGRFLVAGRFMRGFYAAIKAIVFCYLLLLQVLPVLVPSLWHSYALVFQLVATGLIWLTALLCVLRAVPVVGEFAVNELGSKS